MSTAANRKMIEDIFEQMSQGNTRALSEAMADDFRWVFPGNWSWSGVWEPKSVVLNDFLRPLMAQFTEYSSVADFVIADGDRVVAQVRAHARTTRGEPYEQTYCFVFRIAEGKLTEVIEHCDTALVERVLHPIPTLPREARASQRDWRERAGGVELDAQGSHGHHHRRGETDRAGEREWQ